MAIPDLSNLPSGSYSLSDFDIGGAYRPGSSFGGGVYRSASAGGYQPASAGTQYKPEATTAEAAGANLAAAPDLASLSELINTINQQANLGRVPRGAELEALSSENIYNELAGNLPQSQVDRMRQAAAERGIGFGPDSPATQASLLRQLNIDQLAMQRAGQQDLTAAYQRAAPLYDISQSLISPSVYAQQAAEANRLAQQRSQFNIEMAQRRAEAEARLAAEYAAMARQGRGGGGGGGGSYYYPASTEIPYTAGTRAAVTNPMVGGGGTTATAAPTTTPEATPESGLYYDPLYDQYYDPNEFDPYAL